MSNTILDTRKSINNNFIERLGFLDLTTIALIVVALAILFMSNVGYGMYGDWHLFPFLRSGKIAHYYMNYFDFGFIKRGLFGTVIKLFIGTPSLNTVRFIAFITGVAICIILCYKISKLKQVCDKRDYYILIIFMLFNSGVIYNIGYDLGRYDQLLMICCVASYYAIKKNNIYALIIIAVIGVLIHEIYFIFFFPIILYTIIIHSDIDRKKISLLLAVLFGVGILLLLYGKIENKTLQQIASMIPTKKYRFDYVGVIWKRSIIQNITYTFGYISKYNRSEIIWLIAGAIYTSFVFLILIRLAAINDLDYRGYFVIIMASLPIFILAIDYSRWFSLIIINAFLYFLFTVSQKRTGKIVVPKKYSVGIISLAAFGIILGPIGVIRSFPLFDGVLNYVFLWLH